MSWHMQLPAPFLQFPFRFDALRMQAEIADIPEEAWMTHPGDYPGNSALPLVSTRGERNNAFAPPMRPTAHLAGMPYVQQVMAQFETVLGRARLMRLEPGSDVLPHNDLEYYWRSHTRVHVPVVTHPEVRFHCGDAVIHMGAGEAYTFDNWRPHMVENRTPVRRVHLVFDTFGSAAFWRRASPAGGLTHLSPVPYVPGKAVRLAFESHAPGPILAAGDVEQEIARIIEDISAHPGNPQDATQTACELLVNLVYDWRCAWASIGPTDPGIPVFQRLIEDLGDQLSVLPPDIRVASNGIRLMPVLRPLLAAMAPRRNKEPGPQNTGSKGAGAASTRFDRPVFIVSAPRSGSTLLFETLAVNEALWTVGGESHGLIEGIAPLHARTRGFSSNRLTEADLTADIGAMLHANFVAKLVPGAGARSASPPPTVRFLEKTPKNSLRIPFFKALYPDAKFIFLHREPKANISAIIEAWRSGKFVTYPGLPGWLGLRWSLLLIPGWQDLVGAPLELIAARQWRDTNETILSDLAGLPREDWTHVAYEDLLSDAQGTAARLFAFMGVPMDAASRHAVANPLPAARYTLTPPSPDKWRTNEAAIARILSLTEGTARRIANLPGDQLKVRA